MKKIELLLLCGLINISLIAQSSNNQLFQSISGNLKDPSFFINTNYFHTNSLLFELHDSTSSNICLSDYSTGIDSFLTPVLLTNNNYQNINPVGIWVGDKKIVFFQTNSPGKWNIAYREYLNGTWGDAKVISDPTGNDISLSVIKYKIYYYYGNLPVGIVYQKNNSIYIFTKNDSVESNREVIQGSDSLKYSSPSAMYDYVYYSNEWNYPAIRITAIQTDNLQNQRIIEKDISLSSNIDTTFIVDEGDVNNPHFITNNSFYLSYDKSENQRTSVYSFNGYPDKFILNDTLNGDFSNFQNENTVRPIIDKASSYNFVDIYPYIYNYQSNDSNFIGASSGVNSLKDTLIFTRVKSPKSAIEYVAYQQLLNKEENYLVWEDSSNGSIKLFTHKMLVPVYGDVKTTNTPSVFQLYQNYPNPFNPSTTISYEIPKSGLVQLKIYDVLGREITALVNEMQPAGRHFVVFNSKQVNKELSSGIYLYRLRFGNNMVSNKMILVK